MAKKELFKNPFFANILRRVNALPVSRRGFDRAAIEMSLKVLKNGYGLTIFPEGTRSKTDDFLSPKPGMGMIAQSAKCPILPVYIQGTNRFSDCFFGRHKMIIAYGELFTTEWLDTFPNEKESYLEITKAVMDRIKKLKKHHNK
jgi:1-acyl-sn-glycerol-3-phosphate acyltransferase